MAGNLYRLSRREAALRLPHVPCRAGIYARPGPPYHRQASNRECGGLLSRYALNEIIYRCVQVTISHAMPLKRAHSNSGAINQPRLCNRITSHINLVTEPNGTVPRISPQSAIFCDVARYRNNAGRSDFLSEISGRCTRKPDLENLRQCYTFQHRAGRIPPSRFACAQNRGNRTRILCASNCRWR